jgi:hypothetical protein
VYAERRGLNPLRPESAILAQEAREAEQQREIAAGRAGFRARYEAHRQQQAAEKQAHVLVGEWDRLIGAYNAALPGLKADPATLEDARKRLLGFDGVLGEQPEAAEVLRERGTAFGMEERPNLWRVLSSSQPERVITGVVTDAEASMRQELRVAAEQEAARQRKLDAERQRLAPRQGPSQGMSMGR